MKTREVAALSGATQRQLQFWDERGLFGARILQAGHRRKWTPELVRTAWLIAALRRKGLTLKEVRKALKLPALAERRFLMVLMDHGIAGARRLLLADTEAEVIEKLRRSRSGVKLVDLKP
jgi:DNA-binding transcriptional MerR regulator